MNTVKGYVAGIGPTKVAITVYEGVSFTPRIIARMDDLAVAPPRQFRDEILFDMQADALERINEFVGRMCHSGHIHPTTSGRIFCDLMAGYP